MKRLIVLTLILTFATPVLSTAQASSGQTISLALEGVPIAAALNMIATQNELNLVVSGDVDGDVTLRLEDVSITTALDAILLANGYNYFMRDNVIVVKSAASDAAGELDTKVMTLKYLHPVTAVKALSSVKSSKGSVTILDKTGENNNAGNKYHANRIIITDYPALLERLIAVIEEIDVPERSLMIEAKIIETTIDSESNLGVTWPTALNATLGGTAASTESSSTESVTGGDPAAGTYDPSNGDWTWGKLSVGEVSWILNMLEQDGNSRLISDPRITTLENHEAEFNFFTIIPIQTLNRFTEGAATSDIVTFEDEEVGISLRVIARINEDERITLEVEPIVEDIVGYAGPTDNQKPITASRSILTHITVNDGETVALGGLLKETEIEQVQRLPLLGHIPVLGKFLFSSKSTQKSSTDLLILITPHLID